MNLKPELIERILIICKKAIVSYGNEAQIKMTIEEGSELITSSAELIAKVSKLLTIMMQCTREKRHIDMNDVREELADVFLMVIQMGFIYGDFSSWIEIKLNRLENKLNKEGDKKC